MPKVTAGAIIDEVRGQLNDPNAVRWSNTVLFRYIFSGENQMSGNHPETTLSDDDPEVSFSSPVLLTLTTQSTTISVEHAAPLVHFVCASCFREDADDSANLKLADYHFNMYKQLLGDVQVR